MMISDLIETSYVLDIYPIECHQTLSPQNRYNGLLILH